MIISQFRQCDHDIRVWENFGTLTWGHTWAIPLHKIRMGLFIHAVIWLNLSNILYLTIYHSSGCDIVGALVCMSRRDTPVYPGDVINGRWSGGEPGTCFFVVHFLPHDVNFSIHRCCQAPSRGGKWRMYTSRSSGQHLLRPWPWWLFVDHEILFYFVQELISPNSYLCI